MTTYNKYICADRKRCVYEIKKGTLNYILEEGLIEVRNKSFEKFFFTIDGRIHCLAEIQREYESKKGDISKFKGFMRCPECRQAELGFTHRTRSKREYLSKNKTAKHAKNCSYINDYINKKQIKKIIDNLGENQIRDRLEAVLNTLLNNNSKKEDVIIGDAERNNPCVRSCSNGNSSVRKMIPRKSLNMWLDKEDEGKIFIFYGRVKLNIDTVKSKKDSSVYYRLIINTKKRDGSWGYKTKVFRGQYKDEIECGREYDIAMLGHIKFYKKIPEIEVARNALLYRAR